MTRLFTLASKVAFGVALPILLNGASWTGLGAELVGRTLPILPRVLELAGRVSGAQAVLSAEGLAESQSPAESSTTTRAESPAEAEPHDQAERPTQVDPPDQAERPAQVATPPPPPPTPPAQTKPPARTRRSSRAKSPTQAEPSTPADRPTGDAQTSKNDQDNTAGEEDPGVHWHTHHSNNASVTFGPSETVVPPGEKNLDDIVSIGGRVSVQGDALGDVVVIAGVLKISGSVRGDVIAVGSRVYLESGAHIQGALTSVAGVVDRAPNVHIGDTFTSVEFPNLSRFATGRGAFAYLAMILFWLTILFTAFRFLAILVIAAVAPARIDAALLPPRPSWVLAFFLGLLVYLFGHLLVLIFCLLLPLGVALWIALHVAIWMGLASIYLNVGRSIGRSVFGKSLSYFGAILTGFALFAVMGLIPCFGWVLNGMASMVGLGLMLLTRFGSPTRGLPPPPAASIPKPPPASIPTPPGS